MRGDASLFADGMAAIAARTGWEALGLVPFLDAVRRLPAEDAADLAAWTDARQPGAKLRIAVPMLPCIANFDDLDPLRAEPGVAIVMVPRGTPLPRSAERGNTARVESHHRRSCQPARRGLGHRHRRTRARRRPRGRTMRRLPNARPDDRRPRWHRRAARQGRGPRPAGRRNGADRRQAAGCGSRVTFAARPFAGYEMHIGRTTGPGTRLPDADLRRRPAGRGGVGRWPRRRHLRPWAVHG